MGMIMITHNMGVVVETADHIAVMYAGQIVEQATALDLFDLPEHPYTEALLGALPKLDQPDAQTPASRPFPAGPPTCARRRRRPGSHLVASTRGPRTAPRRAAAARDPQRALGPVRASRLRTVKEAVAVS